MKFVILLLLIPFMGLTQDVTFCEKVDNSGTGTSISTRFKISRKGGTIKMLVHCGKKIGSDEVVFDIYSLKDGKEKFENSIRMATDPFNSWFYKELTFYKEGDFLVYVYDNRDQVIGVGKVTLTFRD
jgi:hypothetical protein